MGSFARWGMTLAALLAVSAPAFAQSYPAKPIRVILPFAGGTDAVARLLSAKMSPAIGHELLPDRDRKSVV